MYEVAIIGAGIGGLTAAAHLLEAGIDDFVILERGDDVGGTWRDNTYPGIGVDIPAVMYQFSFARNAQWSRLLPLGEEVQQYLVDTASNLGLEEHLRYNANVVREVWDDDTHVWHLETEAGEKYDARFVISAKGPFVQIKEDAGIPGVEDFQGQLQRPARWDHSYDYRGKRVAAIGTGASSVQLVPALAADVEHLTVFQRTPVWCIPRPQIVFSGVAGRVWQSPLVAAGLHNGVLAGVNALSQVFRAPPALGRPVMFGLDESLRTLYRGYLRLVVDDKETRKALLPRYGFIAKRPTGSNGFLQAFNRDNVDLVTSRIERITKTGIQTADGTVHEVDMIVLATGYDMHNDHRSYPPGSIVGRNGFDQGELYEREGVQAYESVAVKGIPNRWMTSGPYCWTGGIEWYSVVLVTTIHAVRAITEARRRGATSIQVTDEAHDRHQAEVKRRGRVIDDYFQKQRALGVNTYWVNSQEESTAVRPTTVLEARKRARTFSFHDYEFDRCDSPAPPAEPAHDALEEAMA